MRDFPEMVLSLSQLDGEGMRQMQLQQENASKEAFEEHLLKQASDTTGVNISDLRHSSNAVAQTNRINNMLRPTNFRDVFVQQGTTPSRPSQFTNESSETFQQGSNPTQFTDASFETFHQGSNPTQFTDAFFETSHQGSNPKHFFNIGDDVNTSAATADHDQRAERHELATQEENDRLNKDTSRWPRVLDKRLSQHYTM